MPGHVIHLAIAEEYLRKHKEKEEIYNEFIEGVIAPDLVKDKSLTHYGKGSSEANLYKFLQENKINESFKRGYFLHLVTDYLFYNKYIDTFSKEIYNDYDLLNKGLIEKYNVKLPEKISKEVFYKTGKETTILKKDIIEKMIEEISNNDIDEIVKEINKKPEKWTKIRPLKRL